MNRPRDTLTAPQAAESPWDVVVVGAGPAGALAARGLAVLRDEGLPAPPVRATPVTSLQLLCGSRRLDLPLPPMVALAREEFDTALVVAAADARAR